MIQTSVASLRWLSPSARNDYRHQIGIVIGFVGIGTVAIREKEEMSTQRILAERIANQAEETI